MLPEPPIPVPGPATPASGPFQTEAHIAHAGVGDGRRRNPLGGLVVSYGLAGAFFGLLLFSRMVIVTLGLPVAAIGVAWVVIAVVALGLLGSMALGWIRQNRTLPKGWIRSDDRYRVRAFAPGTRYDDLRRIGPVEDALFEPQEFSGFLVQRPSSWMVATWAAISLVTAAAIFLLARPPAGLGVFVFYGAFAAGGVAIELIWPTTLRVVPGRIDVIRRFALRPEWVRRRSYSLRTSRVIVDLRTWTVSIDGPTVQTSLHLWLWPIRGRMELAHALLMGAVSSARPTVLGIEGIDSPATSATPADARHSV